MTGPDQPSRHDAAQATTLQHEIRTLRDELAALRELVESATQPSVGAAGGGGHGSRRRGDDEDLSYELSRRDIELTETRRQLLRLERELRKTEGHRQRMLQSRTWKWGSRLAKVGMKPIRAAQRIYGFLLHELPEPAALALRRAVARARGRPSPSTLLPPVTWPSERDQVEPEPDEGDIEGPLVPIPVHGPHGLGAPLENPAVLLVAYEFDADQLGRLVGEVDRLSRHVAGLRVLVVTDSDAFHIFRRYSMVFEYIPACEVWKRHNLGHPYDEFRATRLEEILRVYAPDRILFVRGLDDFRAVPPTVFAQ